MCTDIARLIQGKHKPNYYNTNPRNGDRVYVLNATNLLFKGRRIRRKKMHYHTNYPGAKKEFDYKYLINSKPELIIFRAVYKNLPKNTHRFDILDKLIVYRGNVSKITKYFLYFRFAYK